MSGDGAEQPLDLPDEEELRLGHSLVPERIALRAREIRLPLAAKIVAALAVVAVAGVILHGVSDSPAAPRAKPSPSAAPVGHTGALTPFEQVLALAAAPQLVSEIRQSSPPGACTPVVVGHSPEDAVLRALRVEVTHLRSRDAARTLDQFTGLCALELRAEADDDVSLTVIVTAPPAHPAHSTFDAVEVGVQTEDGVTTTYAQENWHNGWVVLVGASGRGAGVPQTQQLARVAADPSLLW